MFIVLDLVNVVRDWSSFFYCY